MNCYDAIYFDWDGTAVESRYADASAVVNEMEQLLLQGIKLIIISGTTYENIAGGKLHEMLCPEALNNLFLGLGRGAYQYGFRHGQLVMLEDLTPSKERMLMLHKFCYDIHELLFRQYDYNTDIVFCRTNYCKIDLLPGFDRKGLMFLQDSEVKTVQDILASKGIPDGLASLIKIAGSNPALPDVKGTSDAKHLEVGFTTKGDNVDFFVDYLYNLYGISIKSSAFIGDEFADLCQGVPGSDAMMITSKSIRADFYDVSSAQRVLPKNVISIGGGVSSFRRIIADQIQMHKEQRG